MTYVARLVPSKAQDDAIRVLKLLRDAGVDGYLVLVGEGHLKEEKNYQIVLEKQASVLGVAEFVRFTGYQPDVFRYMKAADILLMTSKYEGLPNVAVEAGICSKPLVAYRVCGLSEVIDEGRTGFVVEQGDMNKMASVIAGLARNREALEEIGNAARHKLERQYSMDRMVEEKLGFYRKIIDDVDGRTGSISAEQMILFR
jgi:glycosyltransferase involved in cell wall biosynthesis